MRTALRVAGVYVVMSMSVIAVTLLSLPLFADAALFDFEAARPQLGAGWLAFEFAYSVPIALAAGYVVARWGRTAAFRHVLALAAVVLAMGVFSVVFSAGRKPIGHDVLMTLVGAGAVVAGGFVWMRGSTGDQRT